MSNKPKQFRWLIFAIVSFFVFVLLQVPAAWIISKFYKNNQILHNVSGNIWRGQADWKQGNLSGSVSWSTRPWEVLLLRAGASIEIHSGNTQLEGVVGYGLGKTVYVKSLSGQIAPETLKKLADWQWPANPIQLKDIEFNYKKQAGFAQAEGQMQWAGGELLYTFAQRQDRMNMPSLAGRISDDSGKLLIDVRDTREQKMMNLQLDADLMLDVQLTQRLLLNVASYEGKAGLDTYVISSRQPLIRGGM
ncbi:type II secretion system protein N [Acinetobacter tianfuensis]|uniref:Type II secretion system protein N n=1 Tax=Acinetobacter tianfuensis TaxID=2419603 RepID=A0A3A8E7C6_9GAMM|nr:type II secretion system protein N [Acinetobacter tianfuensis]RKG29486.1 general secretion pathway protein [Acinetobacter tianfuensis]